MKGRHHRECSRILFRTLFGRDRNKTAMTLPSLHPSLWPPSSSCFIRSHWTNQQHQRIQKQRPLHQSLSFGPQYHRFYDEERRRHYCYYHHWSVSNVSSIKNHTIRIRASSSLPSSSSSSAAEAETAGLHNDIHNNNNHFDPIKCGDDDQLDPTSRLSESSSSSFSQTFVSISEDGQMVSIILSKKGFVETGGNATTTTTTTITLPGPLLWVNDPQYIHPTSGQRLRSLGQFTMDGCAISSADIVVIPPSCVGVVTTENSTIHPQPLLGSMHPRGGIYHTKSSKESTTDDSERHLLRVKRTSGDESFFDLQWLIDHCREGRIGWLSSTTTTTTGAIIEDTYHNNVNSEIEPSSLTRVTKDVAIGAITNPNVRSIPIFEYAGVMENNTNGTTLLRAMQGIYEHGAILIKGAPPTDTGDESIVGNLGKLLSGGRLSHGSLYGDIFHVETKADAENIAYTNVPLPPHQDLTYYESKPFLQLLHCVNDEETDGTDRIIGGESVLIDAMAAAEELRLIAPDIFNVLCRYEATFLKERDGADMVSPKPHIVTDPTFGQVVEINWSPPFEGPLQLNPQIPLEDYVMAYQAMECLLDDQSAQALSSTTSSLLPVSLERTLREYARTYTWEYSLHHGDILVFNNQRMLHGRRGFTMAGRSRRHLIGCYTDAMETTSHYRQLLRERRNIVSNDNNKNGGIRVGVSVGGVGRRNVGNGFRWM